MSLIQSYRLYAARQLPLQRNPPNDTFLGLISWTLYLISLALANTTVRRTEKLFVFSRPYVRSRLCYSVGLCVSPSVCLYTVCIVAKRCVLEQKLLSTAYRKSYMRNRLAPKWMTLTSV